MIRFILIIIGFIFFSCTAELDSALDGIENINTRDSKISMSKLQAPAPIYSFDGNNLPPSNDVVRDALLRTSVNSPNYLNTPSIRFRCKTNIDDTASYSSGYDRTESRLALCGTNDLFSFTRYIGFMVYLDADVDGTTASEAYEIIYQTRQCTSGATPPVSLHLEQNGSGLQFLLAGRTNEDPLNGRNNTASITSSANVQRGQWYQITLALKLKPQGSGILKWWVNGNLQLDYSGQLGRSDLAQNVEHKFGIYRGSSFPTNKGTETVFFNHVRYGSTYSTVQPSSNVSDLVIDNSGQGYLDSGNWVDGTFGGGYANDYKHDSNTGSNTFKWATYKPNSAGTPLNGDYEIYAYWKANTNRASNATVRIYHSTGGSNNQYGRYDDFITNMRQGNSTSGQFTKIGNVFSMSANHYVALTNSNANGYVIADAIKFVPVN